MGYKDPIQQREYQLQWMIERRTAWVLENGPCSCGSWDQLEVDHIDASQKEMNPSAIWSRRQEIREAELAKCQVLCEDCHKAKKRINQEQPRGENSSSAILTASQVLEAKDLYSKGDVTFRELGERYGVHRDTVRYAVRGKTWRGGRVAMQRIANP